MRFGSGAPAQIGPEIAKANKSAARESVGMDFIHMGYSNEGFRLHFEPACFVPAGLHCLLLVIRETIPEKDHAWPPFLKMCGAIKVM